MAHHESKKDTKRISLFEDLSVAQIVAGALAAVTSMLLASRIGIAGSVIGVGVGSVVSAVASQLYKKFLTASARKLRDLRPDDHDDIASPSTCSAKDILSEDKYKNSSVETDAQLLSAEKRHKAIPFSVDQNSRLSDTSLCKLRAQRNHNNKLMRRVVVVSVVSALIAVLVSALVIEFSTGGQGVGERPYVPAKESQSSQPNNKEAPDSKEAPDNQNDNTSKKNTPSDGNSSNDEKSDGGDDKSKGDTSNNSSGDAPRKDGSNNDSDTKPDDSNKDDSGNTSGGNKSDTSRKSNKNTSSDTGATSNSSEPASLLSPRYSYS